MVRSRVPSAILVIFGVPMLIAGCGGQKSGRGFTLPDGQSDRGKTAFVELKCYSCHQVQGVELPAAEEGQQKMITLGGSVPRIQTYGELVTSIINPSHKLAAGYAKEEVTEEADPTKSRMVNNNDVMTVSQLIDLVSFLQSHYKLEPYEPTYYPYY